MKNLILCVFLIFIFSGCHINQKETVIKVLLLSGSNNHNWKETTPLIKQIFEETQLFTVEITNQPDTLTFEKLNKFDVIVSIWNSWPENDVRWPVELEQALLKYIRKGGGFVTFHASSSAFYNWPEFKNISTAAWIMDSTWHGKMSSIKVVITNHEHPVTKGMADFFIFDELWVNAEKNKSFGILGEASNEDISEKELEHQPAIFVKNYGKGRIFHTILGHDARAIRNSGFKQLLLRGTEWAAIGKVIQPIVRELQQIEKATNNWQENDTTFALPDGNRIVWKYNFNTSHGRSFFYPVFVDRVGPISEYQKKNIKIISTSKNQNYEQKF